MAIRNQAMVAKKVPKGEIWIQYSSIVRVSSGGSSASLNAPNSGASASLRGTPPYYAVSAPVIDAQIAKAPAAAGASLIQPLSSRVSGTHKAQLDIR
jgi:hypothetical protein